MATHRNNFDSLRLFGAVLVIFGHSFALTGVPSPGFAANSVQTIGVKIFFVLSGYLVTTSWMRDPHVLRFALRRALRIMPALVVVVAASAFVLGPLRTELPLRDYLSHPFTWLYLKNALLYISYSLPGVFGSNVYPNAVNGSLWTIPVEVAMYITAPLLLTLCSSLRFVSARSAYLAMTALVCAASLAVKLAPVPPAPIVIYGTNVWFVLDLGPFFLIGGAYAVAGLDRRLDLGLACAGLLALALFPVSPVLQEAMLYAVLPYACLALGRASTAGLRSAGRFGDVSYGLYLVGFPIQQTVSSLIGTRGGHLLNFLVSLAISFVLAFLLWHLVEKRALALKPRARNAVEVPRSEPEPIPAVR